MAEADAVRATSTPPRPHPGGPARVATVLAHIEAVRDRPRAGLDDGDFTPDWSDRPSPHTSHPGAEQVPLPTARPADGCGSLADAVTYAETAAGGGGGGGAGAETAGAPGLTLRSFAGALHLTAGPLSRRWQIDWNGDAARRARLRTAAWGRGTPSGGANHPWELYWAPAPGLPVPPGLLHYASGRHTLERLATGDATPAIRAALPAAPPPPTGGYLICTLRPWKTAFKYGNFAYHVATHDIGAFLGSWNLLRRAAGDPARAVLDFDEDAVGRVLGLDPGEESAYAVLPLAWHPGEHRAPLPGTPAPAAPTGGGPGRPRAAERSRRPRGFPLLDALRSATAGRRPGAAPGAPPAPVPVTSSPPVPLPRAPVPGAGLAGLLSRRRSAVGRLDPRTPLTAEELAVVLRCAAAASGERSVVRMRVLAQRIEGIGPGSYEYASGRHVLLPTGPTARLAAGDYALENYAVAQAAAVIAFTWRPVPVLDALGAHGYRAAHAEAGAAAQHLHLAAQALGLACGLVLGTDPRAVDRAVTGPADGEDEVRTSLCAFLSPRLPGTAALDDRLV
ncbi:nitroreductase family protein [Streptomyces sp. NPDC048507]|uniref:nitroreductase family protein n=1 Tax=Streptomyces sp. NPDC048507 TaxID=3365560 RepID=UPI00371A7B78